ncbi:hypothetical protein POM88_046722 [Heracleum sosnowskyi]|uniref:Uncharacterized protein n=1 Tax=Heracleum sosnowskyi TaxID=360622 RepID=A0AAD8H9Q4_9APIA|nr:hypothetical protein POM88_046722 [Heracleum sosnowskyi]
MESFTANTRNNGHSRSISLPSIPHPSTANVEEHLFRLRSSESAPSSLLCNKLSGLKELYECIDDLLNLPLVQQKLGSCSDDVLGSSIRLLDLCSTTKDAFLQMRASGRDLESSLRRRDTNVSSKIRSNLICINKVNKMISKCFTSTKKSGSNKSSETPSTVSMLREVEELPDLQT